MPKNECLKGIKEVLLDKKCNCVYNAGVKGYFWQCVKIDRKSVDL